MLRHIATFVLLLGCGAPPVEPTPNGTPPDLITPEQAARHAERGLAGRLPLLPDEYHVAARNASPGEALLVRRIDRSGKTGQAGNAEGRFYYVVPFEREGRTTLVVLVDAASGRFKEASYLGQPGEYPPVSAARARSLLADALPDDDARAEALAAEPDLVWMPSEQSMSPAEPLWRIEVSGEDWYVDQTGGVHPEITEPTMKGGGPPDRPHP